LDVVGKQGATLLIDDARKIFGDSSCDLFLLIGQRFRINVSVRTPLKAA